MSGIRSSGNKSTEIRFYNIVSEHPDIHLNNGDDIFGKPDYIIHDMKIAIFLDGAFWHGHKEVSLPKSNTIFWKDKLLSNKKRDRKVDKTLRGEDWTVIRFWDFELKKSNEIEIIRRLRRVITIKRKENE